jgi:hypothetical protein
MIENNVKIKQAEEMILTELKLLLEETKKGDELETLAGALAAIFRFTFKKAPMDMLAMELITSVLDAIISEINLSKLEGNSNGH